MRTALYARYSAGPRQTDQSIEGQIRVCTDYCKQKGLTITEIYADKHISGKTDDRPEFQRLIADAKKKKFDAVVVYKTDRFARNKYDSAIYKRQLKMNGIQIFYAAESIPDGPEGIILESLMEGLAEYYSAELAQKIKRGMHETALKCKITGGVLPLGYKASKNKTYEIDPDGAKAVKKIFEMYINGKSCREICQYLNSLGLKTSYGNTFDTNSITRIIKNQKYIGVYEAAGVKVEDGIPAIISKETFYLAQKEMERKRVGKKKRKETFNYLLTGKLYCGYCKKLMTGLSGTSHTGMCYHYYHCPSFKKKNGCQKTNIRKEYLEDLVVDKTVEYIMQPDILKDIAGKIYTMQAENDTRKENISYYKKKLNDNKKAIANIVKAIEIGAAPTALLERLQTLESEQLSIEGELAYYETLSFGLNEEQLYFFLTQYLQPDEDKEEYKQKIITSFVHQVYLYNNRFVIYYNIVKGGEAEFENVMLADDDKKVSDEPLPKGSSRDAQGQPLKYEV